MEGELTLTIHETLEQGSDEWLQARCGLISASIMNDILTPTLKASSNEKTRQAVYELACQRVTNYVEPQYWTDAMLRGVADESVAAELYADKVAPVQEIGGMVREFDFGRIWYSPDRLVGDDGLIEIKSRRNGLHFKTVADGDVPKEHVLQLQAGLLVSGRDWIDYISICKGQPLFIKRVEPDPIYHDAILTACEALEKSIADATERYYDTLKSQRVLIETERDPDEMEVYV